MTSIKLYLGDCLEVLRKCPDNYMDSVVCDPPYGLSFMNKGWDYSVPSTEIWKECLRVLKPGGHLLAFGGTRTYHRLVVNVEDAGFEIRDQLQWLYGSGFPKSHNIAKSIDKELGVEATVIGKIVAPASTKRVATMGRPDHSGSGWNEEPDLTEPTSDEAKRWSGYGTALKPANEPICLARKPLSEKTVAKNVLKHGVGGLNVDASRIGTDEKLTSGRHTTGDQTGPSGYATTNRTEYEQNTAGRFPANILFDEYAAGVLDEQSGHLAGRGSENIDINKPSDSMFGNNVRVKPKQENKGGGASRFFYVAKASKKDRNQGLPQGFATWENLDQSQVGQMVTLSAQLKGMLDAGTLPQDDTDWITFLFGNEQTDQSQKDATFITSITSEMTTVLKTLSVLQHLNTKESIRGVIETKAERGLNLVASAEAINQLRPSITNEETVFLLGAGRALLQMLSQIKRNEGSHHPTVKPIKLMEYLIKLVTPEGGIVLDPFMGSGTTGVAAQNLGFGFRGIEMTPEYFEICQARILGAAKDAV